LGGYVIRDWSIWKYIDQHDMVFNSIRTAKIRFEKDDHSQIKSIVKSENDIFYFLTDESWSSFIYSSTNPFNIEYRRSIGSGIGINFDQLLIVNNKLIVFGIHDSQIFYKRYNLSSDGSISNPLSLIYYIPVSLALDQIISIDDVLVQNGYFYILSRRQSGKSIIIKIVNKL